MAGRRQTSSSARAPALPFAGIAGLGVVVVLAASSPIPWSITTRFTPLDAARSYTPTPFPTFGELPPTETEPGWVAPAWVGIVFWALVFLALALVAAALVRWLWRRRPQRLVQVAPESGAVPPSHAEIEADPDTLRRGAQTALQLLDDIPDPQDAVVRSWLALEQAAEASGAARRPADTPTEFTGQVLRSTAADPTAVTRLLNLYHRARFSAHPVGMVEVKEARACVTSLCRTWSGYEDALRDSVRSLR